MYFGNFQHKKVMCIHDTQERIGPGRQDTGNFMVGRLSNGKEIMDEILIKTDIK